MKKIFLLSILLIFFVNCSSGNDDSSEPQLQIMPVPENIKGSWKVSYYDNETTASYKNTNDKGFYIKFNDNNTIAVKDVNGEFVGVPYHSGKGANYYVYTKIENGTTMEVIVQDYSNWFQGGYEFTISYNNSYNKMVFYAKKQ